MKNGLPFRSLAVGIFVSDHGSFFWGALVRRHLVLAVGACAFGFQGQGQLELCVCRRPFIVNFVFFSSLHAGVELEWFPVRLMVPNGRFGYLLKLLF